MLIKKLNQTIESKVLLKLLVVDLLNEVVEAVCEDLVLQDFVVKDLLVQALSLEALSQALIAKLKLIKVKAGLCKDKHQALGKALWDSLPLESNQG